MHPYDKTKNQGFAGQQMTEPTAIGAHSVDNKISGILGPTWIQEALSRSGPAMRLGGLLALVLRKREDGWKWFKGVPRP
jgi:hypothetical protein